MDNRNELVAKKSRKENSYIFFEFLECFVHEVLFLRKFYAIEMFEVRRLYGSFVHKHRNKILCSNIHDIIFSLKEVINNGDLVYFEIIFLNNEKKAFERIVLKFKGIYNVNKFENIENVECKFRNILINMNRININRIPLYKGCDFEILIRTRNKLNLPFLADSENDQKIWNEEFGEIYKLAQSNSFKPFKEFNIDQNLNIELYIFNSN